MICQVFCGRRNCFQHSYRIGQGRLCILPEHTRGDDRTVCLNRTASSGDKMTVSRDNSALKNSRRCGIMHLQADESPDANLTNADQRVFPAPLCRTPSHLPAGLCSGRCRYTSAEYFFFNHCFGGDFFLPGRGAPAGIFLRVLFCQASQWALSHGADRGPEPGLAISSGCFYAEPPKIRYHTALARLLGRDTPSVGAHGCTLLLFIRYSLFFLIFYAAVTDRLNKGEAICRRGLRAFWGVILPVLALRGCTLLLFIRCSLFFLIFYVPQMAERPLTPHCELLACAYNLFAVLSYSVCRLYAPAGRLGV